MIQEIIEVALDVFQLRICIIHHILIDMFSFNIYFLVNINTSVRFNYLLQSSVRKRYAPISFRMSSLEIG